MEININKDIREYKAKVILGFTVREFFGLCLGALGAYAMYAVYKLIVPQIELNMIFYILCTLGAAPGILWGFVKPYGMKMEVYIKTVFIENFYHPRVRIYESEKIIEKEKYKAVKNGKWATQEFPAYK